MKNDKKPWDRPAGTGAPCRPGDRIDPPIFTALGRAVSAWEGVQAATASLYHALLDPADPQLDSRTEEFGEISRVPDRAKILSQAVKNFVTLTSLPSHTANTISAELRILMDAYRGWAERRNDLAHGYVTEARHPDYEDDDQKLITTFSLLPSHARSNKWIHAQPLFNYRASEIEAFAGEFQELDKRLELLASRIGALRNQPTD